MHNKGFVFGKLKNKLQRAFSRFSSNEISKVSRLYKLISKASILYDTIHPIFLLLIQFNKEIGKWKEELIIGSDSLAGRIFCYHIRHLSKYLPYRCQCQHQNTFLWDLAWLDIIFRYCSGTDDGCIGRKSGNEKDEEKGHPKNFLGK